MPLPVYLINLDGSDERLRDATAQLDAAGLTFQRVPAFDGRGLKVDQFPDYDHARTMAYMGRPLRGGEIGCYLSHLECARRFIHSGAKHAVVLEDDMQLKPGFAQGLQIMIAWLDNSDLGWDLINIGANQHKIYTPLMGFDLAGQHHRLVHAHYFPMTAHGLIWSRQGAETFLATHQRITRGVDNHFRHWQTRSGRGMAVIPPLVSTSGAESEIAPESLGGNRAAEGRHPLYGLIKQRRLLTDKLIAWRHKWQARVAK